MKALRSIMWIALSSLVVGAGLFMLQDHLLYFPAAAKVEQLTSAALRAWPGPEDFRGLVGQPAGPVRATVLVFHGNAGHAGHRAHYAATLTRLGLRTILAEYPGYGPRDGAPGERQLVDDAAQSIVMAHRQYGPPLLVIGESLGAGVAAAAAARQPQEVAALMLITPWDRLEHVASHHYPWLPVKWLLRDHYDSAAHLAQFNRPVLVVVAGEDNIVPPRFGVALHDALSAPKQLRVLQGSGHNDWVGRVDEVWWGRAVDFLLGADAAR